MRPISGPALAALAQSAVPVAVLVDMALTTPLRLCTGGWPLTWGGNTYVAAGELGTIGATEENVGEPRALSFELTGVPVSMISQALTEPVQGKDVSIYFAIFDPATYQILDAALEWVGKLDTMQIVEGSGTATIRVSAEHAGFDLLRAVPVRYTHVDQQRLFAGDRGFEYVTDQSDATIVWPAKEFFRR